MPGAARFTVEVPPPADGSTRARTGRLELTHGVVETPQFMPVGTNATVKALDPDEIAAAGATIILANTYHLYLRPGHERIERFGGLHQFMAWDRPILTDSGGYQVVSLGDLRIVDEDGVTFRSHIDGSTHRFTPEHAIAVQEALGSDVAVAFDQPVVPSSPREVVADATARTHRWAERSLAAHRRTTRRCSGSSRAAWTRSCGPSRRGSSRASRSTGSASAGWPATRRRSSATRRSISRSRCWPTIRARATSWGSARRPTCSRRFTGAWTCSIRCCRRGSPGTGSCGSRAAG